MNFSSGDPVCGRFFPRRRLESGRALKGEGRDVHFVATRVGQGRARLSKTEIGNSVGHLETSHGFLVLTDRPCVVQSQLALASRDQPRQSHPRSKHHHPGLRTRRTCLWVVWNWRERGIRHYARFLTSVIVRGRERVCVSVCRNAGRRWASTIRVSTVQPGGLSLNGQESDQVSR